MRQIAFDQVECHAHTFTLPALTCVVRCEVVTAWVSESEGSLGCIIATRLTEQEPLIYMHIVGAMDYLVTYRQSPA